MTRSRALGVISFIALLGAVLGYAAKQTAALRPKIEEVVHLSIPAEALNLGAVWEDDRFAWTATIENREAVSIEITSFRHSCNCLSIRPEAFVLMPGERRPLEMEIDLTRQSKPNGEVAIALFPRLKTTTGTELPTRRPPKWTVTGKVRRILALPRAVDLGRHSELAQPLPVREIPIEIFFPPGSA